MISLKLSSLEFEDIKNNLKDYFKKDKKYTDFNFEGSNLSALLNIMAYNTHYIGYYVKMSINEAFTDTSQTMEAMISHAKKNGYIINSKNSAYASLSIEVKDVNPNVKFITIPKYTIFNAISSTDRKTQFLNLSDYTIKNNNGVFKGDIIVYQGSFVKNTYKVQSDKERYMLSDEDCDINTLKVFVKNSENASLRQPFSQAIDIIDIKNDSEVWYANMIYNGKFMVYFGQDRFGIQPKIGQYIDFEYISTMGSLGNNISKFNIAPTHSTNINNIGYYDDVIVKTIENSHGGVDGEDIDSLRFAIPNHNKRQKRIVTENDYMTAIKDNFRDIETISVYGGEKDNNQRQYSKLFVSIKPYNSDNLSETAKTLIKNNLVKRFGVVGSNIIFVKAQYINMDVDIYVKKNRLANVTDDQIKTDLSIRANEFDKEILNKFESSYSDTDFIAYCKEEYDYIQSIYTRKQLSKNTELDKGKGIQYHIAFNNPISNVTSNEFRYGLSKAYFKSIENDIFVFDSTTDKKLSEFVFGELISDTGDIYLNVPRDIYDNSILFKATPLNPDIETYLNNIVRFNNINVIVRE